MRLHEVQKVVVVPAPLCCKIGMNDGENIHELAFKRVLLKCKLKNGTTGHGL